MTQRNSLTPLLLLAGIALLLIVVRWLTIGYTPQRINDVACRVSAQLVQEAESTGQPLSPTLTNLRKMLESPRVNYRGLPFQLVSHKEHGFDKIDVGPPVIPYYKGGIVILNGKEVALGQNDEQGIQNHSLISPNGKEGGSGKLSNEMQEVIQRAQQELRDSGATPYTEESRIQGFLDSLRRAQAKDIALVIYSPTHKDLLDLVHKTIKAAGNEKFPGVIVIVVTDYVHPLQLDNFARELQVSPHPASYKMGWKDLIFW
jgi:hypothetical protein